MPVAHTNSWEERPNNLFLASKAPVELVVAVVVVVGLLSLLLDYAHYSINNRAGSSSSSRVVIVVVRVRHGVLFETNLVQPVGSKVILVNKPLTLS